MNTEKKILKPFQKWILNKLVKYNHGGLFLNMGLGKTVVSCHYILKKKYKYTLVVVPKIIIGQWVDEIKATTPGHDIVIIDGKLTSKKHFNKWLAGANVCKRSNEERPTVFITNYEFIYARQKLFNDLNNILDCVILDESNYIQNRKSGITKACNKIFKDTENKLILSGTGMLKILMIYSQMKFLKFDFWGTNYYGWFNTFVNFIVEEIYVAGKIRQFKKVTGPCLEMLPTLLKKLRDKGHIIFTEDVNGYAMLPKQTTVALPVDIEDNLFQEYMLFKNNLVQGVGDIENTIHAAGKLVKLQRLLAGKHLKKESNKQKMLYNIIENEIDSDTTPILIWCRFTDTIELLQKVLTKRYKGSKSKPGLKVFMVNGSVTGTKRDDIMNYVKTHTNCILLLQLKVGRFGLDLKNTSAGIFYEFDFSLMNFSQAKARIRRLSSKGSSTNYMLFYKNTIDQYIYESLNKGLEEGELVKEVYKNLR
jgi:SNF2 family DNA or RNA helicase